MFQEFMQMGAPAALVLAVGLGGIGVVLVTAIVNRTIRRNQEQDHQLKRLEAIAKARVVEGTTLAPPRHGD
jgi:hypothetical protein